MAAGSWQLGAPEMAEGCKVCRGLAAPSAHNDHCPQGGETSLEY